MFVLVLCLALTSPVLTREQPPPPPQDVHVDHWQLSWTPAAGDPPLKYTVQYNSFDSNTWLDVPGCVGISSNSCDTAAIKGTSELGCVRLQVWAQSGALRSAKVEACSRHGDTCTPDISLTALPGSLTVHLSRNHSLADEYADNARHRIYFGKEGEPLEHYDDAVSSVTVRGLEAGQRYCMQVQYVVWNDPTGLSTCPRCERIPEPKPVQTGVIVAVVVVVVLTLTAVLILYVLIFHYKTIKVRIRRWMSRYKIPQDFHDIKPSPPLLYRPPEERCDDITVVSPLQPGA